MTSNCSVSPRILMNSSPLFPVSKLVLLHCSLVVLMKIHCRFFRQPLAFFGVHQMALSLFHFITALGWTQVVANTLGTLTLLLLVFVSQSSLSFFILSASASVSRSPAVPFLHFLMTDDIEPWMIWGFDISLMMYGQDAIVINEVLDKRWSTVSQNVQETRPRHRTCWFTCYVTTQESLSPRWEVCFSGTGACLSRTAGTGSASVHSSGSLCSSTFASSQP